MTKSPEVLVLPEQGTLDPQERWDMMRWIGVNVFQLEVQDHMHGTTGRPAYRHILERVQGGRVVPTMVQSALPDYFSEAGTTILLRACSRHTEVSIKRNESSTVIRSAKPWANCPRIKVERPTLEDAMACFAYVLFSRIHLGTFSDPEKEKNAKVKKTGKTRKKSAA